MVNDMFYPNTEATRIAAFISSFKGISFNDDLNSFGVLKNAAVNVAILMLSNFVVLIKLVWLKLFQLLEHHIKGNVADV